MKISESAVAMGSSQRRSKTTAVSISRTLYQKKDKGEEGNSFISGSKKSLNSASVSISEESRILLRRLKEEKRGQGRQEADGVAGSNQGGVPSAEEFREAQLKTLEKLLEALRQMRNWGKNFQSNKYRKMPTRSFSYGPQGFSVAPTLTNGALSGGGVVPEGTSGVWTQRTEFSHFVTETETTMFQTTGIAKTADGREISFHVDVEMSQSFTQEFNFAYENTVKIMKDPLVINLDSNVASVTDQKFRFDLDADGKLDEISFAGQGSGFLALDKNGDGKINDGNELFGTKSGDGFRDLATHDKDKNGWIDENDEVFHKLKIWTKDEYGNDKLISLKEAGVGAIYLGNASTDFTLRGQENEVSGQIRKTGVYLKESGEVGTVQHVDLAM